MKGKHTTIKGHMPSAHRRYTEWTPERIRRWAAQSGRKIRHYGKYGYLVFTDGTNQFKGTRESAASPSIYRFVDGK